MVINKYSHQTHLSVTVRWDNIMNDVRNVTSIHHVNFLYHNRPISCHRHFLHYLDYVQITKKNKFLSHQNSNIVLTNEWMTEWMVFQAIILFYKAMLGRGKPALKWIILICIRGRPWYSGSALDCWSTNRAIDPTPRPWFRTITNARSRPKTPLISIWIMQ